jgi:predicted Fe-Mo cluster-binding NifX family protein
MKIAIPTDDGLHISARCENAKGFVIAEVERDKILHEELHWKPVPDPGDPRTSALSLINGCKVLIAGDSWENCINLSTHSDVEVVLVKETIITNVLVEYIKDQALTASNNLCCP